MFYLAVGLTVLSFIAVVWALVMGGLSLRSNTPESRIASNTWMRRRVMFQVVAVLMLFLTIYIKNKGA